MGLKEGLTHEENLALETVKELLESNNITEWGSRERQLEQVLNKLDGERAALVRYERSLSAQKTINPSLEPLAKDVINLANYFHDIYEQFYAIKRNIK